MGSIVKWIGFGFAAACVLLAAWGAVAALLLIVEAHQRRQRARRAAVIAATLPRPTRNRRLRVQTAPESAEDAVTGTWTRPGPFSGLPGPTRAARLNARESREDDTWPATPPCAEHRPRGAA